MKSTESFYTLGVSSSNALAGAALIRKGNVIGGIREEHITRRKDEKTVFPQRSVEYLFRANDLSWGNIKRVAIPGTRTPDIRTYVPHDVPISVVDSHRAEAELTFRASPFTGKQALIAVLGLDAESLATMSVWIGSPTSIRPIDQLSDSHIPEMFFTQATSLIDKTYATFADFTKRVANLEPPTSREDAILRKISTTLDEFLQFDDKREKFTGREMTIDTISRLLASFSTNTERVHALYEYAVYTKITDSVKDLIGFYLQKLGVDYVCVGGNLAGSADLNTALHKADLVDHGKLSSSPFPEGIASYVGAALVADTAEKTKRNIPKQIGTVFLGKEYSHDEIETVLQNDKFKYKKYEDFDHVSSHVSGLLAEGHVIAWFQSGVELGARALGNRNILVNLADSGGAQKLNRAKQADPNKRVALVVTEESARTLFTDAFVSPHMSYLFAFNPLYTKEFPHLHGVVRPHILLQEQNPQYWQLLSELQSKGGIAGAYKSSFNISGQPVVESPSDALAAFGVLKHIDYLVMGNYLVARKDSTPPQTS